MIAKAERKGRTRAEVDEVTFWLTGYIAQQINELMDSEISYGDFFRQAPAMNSNREKITGIVCGVRVENVEDPLMRDIRYLDKLVDELAFFDNRSNELEMYETLLDRLSQLGCEYSIRVQKTQISLSNRYMFACVSLARVEKKTELPLHYLVVTFGLNYAKNSERIAVCTEAAQNRWTHHVVIYSVSDIDEELLGWLQEAYEFNNRK